jgi:hypothetical protein
MKLSKPVIAIGGGILLAVGALAIEWKGEQPLSKSSANPAKISRLFSSNDESLEGRISRLEESLKDSMQIQSKLFELVDELRGQLEQNSPDRSTGSAMETQAVALRSGQASRAGHQPSYRDRYQRHRDMQRQRLIENGLAPDRADFILSTQERFQYEQMQLAYEYQHIEDKSSPAALALQERMNQRSDPQKVIQSELSEQEFEQYQQAYGMRQEMHVNSILEDTPAYNAGLRPGDRILSYDGKKISHMGDLQSQIFSVKPGKTVEIEIQREGSTNKQSIYVPSGPLGIRG